jgi:hypothetical protein
VEKKIIWLFLFIGSAIGGCIPLFWGDGLFSFSSVIFTGIGGLLGIWAGFKLTR